MAQAIESGLYLLSPTHLGSGQSAGAIDLPIARERHTDHPLLPASAIKGVLRDLCEEKFGREHPTCTDLFGPQPPQKRARPEVAGDGKLVAGHLIITDGLLLAFPVRSLSHAFVWVTCPLNIHRWQRRRQSYGLSAPDKVPQAPAATFATSGPLVLEQEVVRIAAPSPELKLVAEAWGQLLPRDALSAQLPGRLVMVDDPTFCHLVRSCTTVQARIQLTPGKTTDEYKDEQGNSWKGNLWYEECLPPDCLFSAIISHRPGKEQALKELESCCGGEESTLLQIGGNETVGQGQCRFTLLPAPAAAAPKSAPAQPRRGGR